MELFHRLADRSSAKVRRFVVERGLTEAVRFRNVAYEEAARDLRSHGGGEVPSLWDGGQLIVGAEAIISRLLAYADVGRP